MADSGLNVRLEVDMDGRRIGQEPLPLVDDAIIEARHLLDVRITTGE